MRQFASQYLTTLAWAALLSAVFWIFERLRPAERDQPVSRRLLNLAYYPFILATVFALQLLVAPAFAFVLARVGGGLLPRWLSQPDEPLEEVLFAVAFALAWDVWQYWVHRWQHTSPMLWNSHRFHHDETALNSSAQARHHVLNYVLFLVLYLPLLLLFGSLAPHAFAAFVMFRLYGFINHSNVRIGLGGATAWIAGPQWHRIHHSVQPEHRDKNFAAFFPFIDKVFGTYYQPASDEYPRTGLTS